MAENEHSATRRQTTIPRPGLPRPDSAADNASIWVTPAPVLLTADQVAAALYAFSELIDECADPALSAVREEIRFLVARHGADAIEHIADWLAIRGLAPFPASLHANPARKGRRSPKARLAWCRQQSQLLLMSADA